MLQLHFRHLPNLLHFQQWFYFNCLSWIKYSVIISIIHVVKIRYIQTRKNTRSNALLIFKPTRPSIPSKLPALQDPVISPNSSVLKNSICESILASGKLDHNKATAPAVIGDEKEVPKNFPYPPLKSSSSNIFTRST